MVPCREVVAVLGSTRYDTAPLPLLEAPLTIVIQLLLLTAVQGHPVVVLGRLPVVIWINPVIFPRRCRWPAGTGSAGSRSSCSPSAGRRTPPLG